MLGVRGMVNMILNASGYLSMLRVRGTIEHCLSRLLFSIANAAHTAHSLALVRYSGSGCPRFQGVH